MLADSFWQGLLNEVGENLSSIFKLPFPILQLPCAFLPTFSISDLNKNETLVAEHQLSNCLITNCSMFVVGRRNINVGLHFYSAKLLSFQALLTGAP